MKTISQRPFFIGLSCLSIGCLIGSFAYPLQKLELYRQTEKGQFDVIYAKTYLVTENDLNYPYGFDKSRARKFAQIHVDYKVQKILLLALGTGCSVVALTLGKELVPMVEHEEEISRLTNEGKKELSLKAIKQRFALANKSQQLLFLDEMKALMEEFGSAEQESMEADEINALYEEHESTYETSPTTSSQPDYRSQFSESMDTTSWKAVSKALSEGVSRTNICKEVLQCSEEIGLSYISCLEQKFRNS